MNESATAAWLAIAASRLGAPVVTELLKQFGSAEAIVAARAQRLAEAAVGSEQIAALQRPAEPETLARTVDWLADSRHSLVTLADADYPDALRLIPDAPLTLFALGDTELLSMPSLAIVGSRKPTAAGRDTARAFAAELAGNGLGIVSGLALGVDAAAHEGALAADGATVAVLGTGIDQVYPAANRELAGRIAANGVIVSELPLGTGPLRYNFPRRNRIISGLALGTLVVEAARRSGSLITARLAAEQGREVFAIPGSIHNPMARGCHRLIRDGAKLVETTADVFAELASIRSALGSGSPENGHPKRVGSDSRYDADPLYDKLLNALGFDPANGETLASRTGLTIAEVSSMLLLLELEGVIEALPGGRYVRLRQEPQAT